MDFDLSLAISLLAFIAPILGALNDRRKVYSDINSQIIENVKKSIQIREDDNIYLEKKLAQCYIEKRHKSDYAEYLWDWIRTKAKTKLRPKTFEKFKIRKAQ